MNFFIERIVFIIQEYHFYMKRMLAVD